MTRADHAAALDAGIRTPVEIFGASGGPLAAEASAVEPKLAVEGLALNGAAPALSETAVKARAPRVARGLQAGGAPATKACMRDAAFVALSADFGAATVTEIALPLVIAETALGRDDSGEHRLGRRRPIYPRRSPAPTLRGSSSGSRADRRLVRTAPPRRRAWPAWASAR